MESFFNTDLRNFAQEDGLIKQHQFAYSKFSSTTVALFRVVDYLNHVIILILCYLQTIPRFILVLKTLARPSTEFTRISKALNSGSLTMVLFVTRKRR